MPEVSRGRQIPNVGFADKFYRDVVRTESETGATGSRRSAEPLDGNRDASVYFDRERHGSFEDFKKSPEFERCRDQYLASCDELLQCARRLDQPTYEKIYGGYQ